LVNCTGEAHLVLQGKFGKLLTLISVVILTLLSSPRSFAGGDSTLKTNLNDCILELETLTPNYSYNPEAAVKDLKLAHLFIRGVGHMKIPDKMILQLRNENYSDLRTADYLFFTREFPKSPALTAIVNYLIKQVKDAVPIPLRIRDVALQETMGFGSSSWHTDHHSQDQIRNHYDQVKADLLEWRKEPFSREGELRVTLPLPLENQPGTIVKPWGEDEGGGIQPPYGFATAFMSKTTFHRGDEREGHRQILVISFVPGVD
jgi:hypothetical protein